MAACKLEAQMLDDSCTWQWPCPLSAGQSQKSAKVYIFYHYTLLTKLCIKSDYTEKCILSLLLNTSLCTKSAGPTWTFVHAFHALNSYTAEFAT